MVRVWNRVRTHHNIHSQYMLELLVCIELETPLMSQLRIVKGSGPISIARMTFSCSSRVINLLAITTKVIGPTNLRKVGIMQSRDMLISGFFSFQPIIFHSVIGLSSSISLCYSDDDDVYNV